MKMFSTMNWRDLKKRLGLEEHLRPAHFVMPTVALELQPGFVAGARLNALHRQVERAGVCEFEAGALIPSTNRPNLTDDGAVRRAIGEVVALIGNGSDRIGLLIPDVSVRVALLAFDALPDKQREAESVVRWRLREFLPFAPEEARVSYQILSKREDGAEVLGMAVRSSVLAEYEGALEGINGGPALVLPATAALLPLLPEDKSAQLLLHVCPGSLTAVLVVLDRIRFWHTRALQESGQGAAGEVAREAARVLATCQDQFRASVQTVWYCARPPAASGLKAQLAAALGRELLPLPGTLEAGASLPEGEQQAFQNFGAPFAGLVANPGERP